MYLTCGPRQPLYFQCGPEMTKGWTPCKVYNTQEARKVKPVMVFPERGWRGQKKRRVPKAGVSKLLASLRHTGRRKLVLVHTLNTLQHEITKKSHILSKCTILCWATFIAILGYMWLTGCRFNTPVT